MWRLLALLVDACNGNKGDHPAKQALLMRVCKSVDTVVREFDNDVELFRVQAAALSLHYAQYLANTGNAKHRVAEMPMTEERRQRARKFADNALQQRLHGQMLPQAIEHFLRRIWSVHVEKVLLLGDGHRPALEAGVALADALLAA
ncbi:MAG TPA: DUF1631 family protein [Xylella sp.]